MSEHVCWIERPFVSQRSIMYYTTSANKFILPAKPKRKLEALRSKKYMYTKPLDNIVKRLHHLKPLYGIRFPINASQKKLKTEHISLPSWTRVQTTEHSGRKAASRQQSNSPNSTTYRGLLCLACNQIYLLKLRSNKVFECPKPGY